MYKCFIYIIYFILCCTLYCLHVIALSFTSSQPMSQLHRRSIIVLSNVPCVSAKKKPTLVAGLVGFFFLLLLIVGVLLVLKLRQTKKNNQRQTAPNQSLQSPYGSAVVPYATYNGQDVYMYAGTPPPGANPHGAAAAGSLPVKAPEYTECLPPAYDSAGYDNPVYGANPNDFQSIPLEGATAASIATAPPSVVPSQPDGNNDK